MAHSQHSIGIGENPSYVAASLHENHYIPGVLVEAVFFAMAKSRMAVFRQTEVVPLTFAAPYTQTSEVIVEAEQCLGSI